LRPPGGSAIVDIHKGGTRCFSGGVGRVSGMVRSFRVTIPLMSNLSVPQETQAGGWLWLLPRLSFVLFIAAVVGLLWLSQKADKEEQKASLITDMLWLEQNLRFQLNHNEELLGRMDLPQTAGSSSFDDRARMLIDNQTGLRAVRWLDARGRLKFETAAFASARFDPQEITLAASLRRPVYGAAYAQTDGDWWFDVYVPYFRNGRAAGFFVGAYSLRRLLDDGVPWWLAERYRIVVADAAGKPLATRSKIQTPDRGVGYQMEFDPPGNGLSLQATPYRSPPPLAGRLLSGALVALAIAVLWSLWALRRHVQRRLVAERALREEHAFRQAMGDSLQTGLRARDLQGRITYVNPAFCRMVGWSAEELIGRAPPMPYWVDEDIDSTRALHDRILAGEGPETGFEIRLKRRNGETFPALIHEARLIDAGGRQVGWMSSIIDISEQKRAEELARQQQERLQATARLVTMGEMASSLAHELNQPLTAIAGYNAGCLNQLESGSNDLNRVRQALAKSTEQAERAGRIIRRIYGFVGRSGQKTEPCDIRNLIDETLALMDGEIRRNGIHVSRAQTTALPKVDGDRVLLGQVLVNLIRNAVDALRDMPTARRSLGIATALADEQIEIQVTDSGPGIAADVAEHLYEPFFTTKPEGMGMGLNICRSVIEAHRGRLWCECNPDGGSIFTVRLPVGHA
jgi:two-component system, LuxR family, sensor histidine kinase DctS